MEQPKILSGSACFEEETLAVPVTAVFRKYKVWKRVVSGSNSG